MDATFLGPVLICDLPAQLIVQILSSLDARSLRQACAVCIDFHGQSASAAEQRMEELDSVWPTLLPGESPVSALRMVEMLGSSGSLWRWMRHDDGFDFEPPGNAALLLHHRPTGMTMTLAARRYPKNHPWAAQTWPLPAEPPRERNARVQCGAGHFLLLYPLEHARLLGKYYFTPSSVAQANSHRTVVAGDPLELLVRKLSPWATPGGEGTCTLSLAAMGCPGWQVTLTEGQVEVGLQQVEVDTGTPSTELALPPTGPSPTMPPPIRNERKRMDFVLSSQGLKNRFGKRLPPTRATNLGRQLTQEREEAERVLRDAPYGLPPP